MLESAHSLIPGPRCLHIPEKRLQKRSSRDGRVMTKSSSLLSAIPLPSESLQSALLEMLLLFEILNLNGLLETPVTLRMLCAC